MIVVDGAGGHPERAGNDGEGLGWKMMEIIARGIFSERWMMWEAHTTIVYWGYIGVILG